MNAAALDSGCVAAVCVSSTQGSAALAARKHALQRSGELELLDPHARRHLHIRLQLRAQLRVRRRQVLRAKCTPSERESSNGDRTIGATYTYDDGLVAPVRLHRGDRPSVQADLVLLHRIHSLRTPPATAKRHCQVKHKRVRVVWFGCSNHKVFQTPGPIRHPTKTTGCPTILATGLGLTPPGSLSRMRSLQPFSSQ